VDDAGPAAGRDLVIGPARLLLAETTAAPALFPPCGISRGPGINRG
jgi:hypothetical protein